MGKVPDPDAGLLLGDSRLTPDLRVIRCACGRKLGVRTRRGILAGGLLLPPGARYEFYGCKRSVYLDSLPQRSGVE